MPPGRPRFPRVGPEAFLRRAEERSLRVARMVREAERSRQADPELLHELHREVRRARLDLRVLSRWRSGDRSRPLRSADRELSEISELVGEARDRDVLGERLQALRSRTPPRGRAAFDGFLKELAAEGRRRRKKLRRGAWRWLEQARPALPIESEALHRGAEEGRRFDRAVVRELKEGDQELQRALARARKRPSVRRLHRLRIAIRRLRQLRHAVAVQPQEADLPAVWRNLQQLLGRHHDLGVLEAWVASRERSSARREVRRAVLAAIAEVERTIMRTLRTSLTPSSSRATGGRSGAARSRPGRASERSAAADEA